MIFINMMHSKKIYNDIFNNWKSFLFENVTENDNKYILLFWNDDGDNEEFEEYGIDPYDASNKALEIAKKGGVNILSDKNLLTILLDTELSTVIGAGWVSNDSDTFSFDIAIDSSYQNKGLSKKLIEAIIDEYKYQKSIYDDMNQDFKMEVDVINPKLAEILKTKYGFYVVETLGPDRVLMSIN